VTEGLYDTVVSMFKNVLLNSKDQDIMSSFIIVLPNDDGLEVMLAPITNDTTKMTSVFALSVRLHDRQSREYFHATTGWMVAVKPDEEGHYKNPDLPPSKHPDRVEVMTIARYAIAEAVQVRMFKIVRSDAPGELVALLPLPVDSTYQVQSLWDVWGRGMDFSKLSPNKQRAVRRILGMLYDAHEVDLRGGK
jgi:hypothetical protein